MRWYLLFLLFLTACAIPATSTAVAFPWQCELAHPPPRPCYIMGYQISYSDRRDVYPLAKEICHNNQPRKLIFDPHYRMALVVCRP